ncbi:MAG: hypothetical protein ACRET8_09455 [Burkholderiales bacterium]
MAFECDVLVAGSGAGGLAAAVTARMAGLEEYHPDAPGGRAGRRSAWCWPAGDFRSARHDFRLDRRPPSCGAELN